MIGSVDVQPRAFQMNCHRLLVRPSNAFICFHLHIRDDSSPNPYVQPHSHLPRSRHLPYCHASEPPSTTYE